MTKTAAERAGEIIEREADRYDLRATEFDSIGEPELAGSVKFNEGVAEALRFALGALRARKAA
jgi:hypothetical protein